VIINQILIWSHPQEPKRIAYHFQAYVYWDGYNQVNQPTELKLGSTSLFGYVTPKKKKKKKEKKIYIVVIGST
jgi:hypothetical protein